MAIGEQKRERLIELAVRIKTIRDEHKQLSQLEAEFDALVRQQTAQGNGTEAPRPSAPTGKLSSPEDGPSEGAVVGPLLRWLGSRIATGKGYQAEVIAEAIAAKNINSVRSALIRLEHGGQIERVKRGHYRAKTLSANLRPVSD